MSASLGVVRLSKLQTRRGFYDITRNSVTDFSWTSPVFLLVSSLCSRIQLRALQQGGAGVRDRLFPGPSKVLQLGLSEMTDDLEEIRQGGIMVPPTHTGTELSDQHL